MLYMIDEPTPFDTLETWIKFIEMVKALPDQDVNAKAVILRAQDDSLCIYVLVWQGLDHFDKFKPRFKSIKRGWLINHIQHYIAPIIASKISWFRL